MESQLAQLKDLFSKGNDPSGCYKLAQSLRSQLLLSANTQTPQTIGIMCEVLEISALLTLLLGNLEQFDNLAAQLQAIYFEKSASFQSAGNASLLVALMLMRLLTDNKIAEFHLLLERIQNWSAIYSDQLISFPVNLEQSLMEGSFRQVLVSVSNAPSPYFAPFNSVVAHAVRETIASGAQCSFEWLTLGDLGKMLFLGSVEEVIQFARGREWNISADNTKVLFSVETSVEHEASAYCTQMLLANLGLAREMESII